MRALVVAALAFLTLGAGPPAPQPPGPQAPPPSGTLATRLEPVRLVYRQMEGAYLKGPRGVWVDPRRGEVYVADTMNDLVVVFDRNGVPLFAFGYNGEFKEPVKAVADAEGRIYVLSGIGGKLKVFNYRGEYLRDFPFGSVGPVVATTLTADERGTIYIADSKRPRILVYDSAFTLKRTIEGDGSGGGRFEAIQSIAVDRDGQLYVTDARALPLQIFTAEGKFIRGWGEHAAGPQNFSLPSGIAVDREGKIVVVDSLRQTISMFLSDGTFLTRVGGYGAGAGAVAFPTDIAADREGRLYIVERVGSRLQIFEQRVATNGRNGRGGPRPRQVPERAKEEIRRSLGDVMGNNR